MRILSAKVYTLSNLFPISYLLFPLLASAEPIRVFTTPNQDLTFLSFAQRLSGIANTIIPFLIGVAFVFVIWGIFKYIRHAGDSEKVAEGRMMLVYGVVALFMMLSFWGFVMIIKNSLFG
ncbi:MAG: hypothetical protein UY50_C0031G0012 [Parcubacteria group bacterium GW2011_GWA2_49_9]|nr:MAG: hypothetical protein UY50_C0031G0012 [Parcubacteria group bacterium GW2011_GWA2_49_9]